MLTGPDPEPSIGLFESPPFPPVPPAPQPYRMPEWTGPPEHVVPGVVALELLLVNMGRHAVWISQAEVYPTGVSLRVDLHGRDPAPPGLESGVGTWRFGVQFSDGRKATTFGLGVFSRTVGAGSRSKMAPGILALAPATTR
jgi:hypothetical protein